MTTVVIHYSKFWSREQLFQAWITSTQIHNIVDVTTGSEWPNLQPGSLAPPSPACFCVCVCAVNSGLNVRVLRGWNGCRKTVFTGDLSASHTALFLFKIQPKSSFSFLSFSRSHGHKNSSSCYFLSSSLLDDPNCSLDHSDASMTSFWAVSIHPRSIFPIEQQQVLNTSFVVPNSLTLVGLEPQRKSELIFPPYLKIHYKYMYIFPQLLEHYKSITCVNCPDTLQKQNPLGGIIITGSQEVVSMAATFLLRFHLHYEPRINRTFKKGVALKRGWVNLC